MSWTDVVGSVSITIYSPKAQTRWRLIDQRGVDLAPATTRLRIDSDPYQGTLAYLTMLVDPAAGAVLDGKGRGTEVEFCYTIRSLQTDYSELTPDRTYAGVADHAS